MRITTVRIIVQTGVFALFCAFVLLTTFTHLDDYPGLQFWVSKFLEVDPLVALSTAITTHTLYKGLIWSLVIVIPTLLLGRIFCNWICPFGIAHHFVGWLFNTRKTKQRLESNRYRKYYTAKYYILAGMLVAALFGSLQIGLLDPLVFIHRAFTLNALPALNLPIQGWELPGGVQVGDHRVHQLAWVVGFLFILLLGLNLLIPRFFCRVLCPLGALLGLFSRLSLWRIDRDPEKCTDCDLCLQACEGACDPHSNLRKSECYVCFSCIEDCPHDALSFRFLPAPAHEVSWPDLKRRHALFAGLGGLLFFAWTRTSGRTTRDFSAKAIRPPGSVEELEFLERCIKCDQCIRVCPTNVLQPALMEAGAEGLWTPLMNFRVGFCQLNCTACGHVCPTGAIQRLTVAEKLGTGTFATQGPVKLGTAHYDLGRCLPWSKNIPCVVCEEVCPVSPKAIHCEHQQLLIRDGKKLITLAAADALTLAEYPKGGATARDPCRFTPHEFRGDEATSYHVKISYPGAAARMVRIADNDADTILLNEKLDPLPNPDTVAALYIELKLPKIDTALCIGCGLCERECPVVGDRRAVYVTADGETRSAGYNSRDRNRSVRLLDS